MIKFQWVTHRSIKVIWLQFDYDRKTAAHAKSIGAKWSQSGQMLVSEGNG
jgi:hypothetical protein